MKLHRAPRRWLMLVLVLSVAGTLEGPRLVAEERSPAITQTIADSRPRTWTDNTGRYQVEGELVGLGPQHILLLKSTGRYSTVPLARLSEPDREYVRRVRSHVDKILSSNVALGATPRTSSAGRWRGTQGPGPEIRFDSGWSGENLPEGYVFTDLVHLRVSQQLISMFTRRSFSQTRAVRECILGYSVRGYAQSEAETDVRIVADQTQAGFQYQIRGTTISQTQTDAEVASVHGVQHTRFEKPIRITVNAEGIDVSPSALRSTSHSVITGVTSSWGGLLGRLIRAIAAQQAAMMKPDFDRVAVQIERRRLDREINERVETTLNRVNYFVDTSVKTFEKVPEPFQLRPRFRTTKDHLYVVLSRPVEPTARVPPPPEMPDQPPFVAQIHVSLISEALTDEEVFEFIEPVIERLAAQEEGPVQEIRKRIQRGQYKISWSPGKTWVTVVWYPSKEVAQADSPENSSS